MHLTEDSLVFALGAIVAVEATAQAGRVVAQTTAGAITARLVTITLEHIRTGGALNCEEEKIDMVRKNGRCRGGARYSSYIMSSQDRVFRDRTRILLASERPKECHRCEKPQWRAASG